MASDAMSVLVVLAVAALLGGGVAWSAYLVHVGWLDARDLAEKTAFRHPRSALQWPELRIGSVLAESDEELVLVRVAWPAHPTEVSLLLLRPSAVSETRRLARWCTIQAPITTNYGPATWVEFRRRRTVQRVRALVVAESPGRSPQNGARSMGLSAPVDWMWGEPGSLVGMRCDATRSRPAMPIPAFENPTT